MRFVRAPLNYTVKIMNKMMRVEVAYALPDRQEIIAFDVEEGCDIQTAIGKSGMLQRFPEIDLGSQKVGVFSKKRELTDILQPGDRIEIYRPLTIDPKDLRRIKAKVSSRKK